MKIALFATLALFAIGFVIVWLQTAKTTASQKRWPTALDCGIGFVVNFFDALGIGSFATTTSFFKLLKLVPDQQIPGTMNIGVTLPAVLEGYIYLAVIEVDVTTLVLMIAASVVGAWFGAGLVARWPRRTIQIGMATTLLVTACFSLLTQLHVLPGGGELLGLTGVKLLLAVAVNALLGALMTLGIGFFAPCMMVIFLMGMSPRAAFPIMMGSVAFLGPAASVRFLWKGRYNFKSALGLTLGGIPGVLVAAFVVRALPLGTLRWLVLVVVVYTAVMMLRSAAADRARLAQAELAVSDVP